MAGTTLGQSIASLHSNLIWGRGGGGFKGRGKDGETIVNYEH